MAKTDSTAVVQTVACDLGRHPSCRSVVLTLTTAGTVDCSCPCHHPTLTEDQELEQAQDIAQDLLLEMHLEDIHFAEGWS